MAESIEIDFKVDNGEALRKLKDMRGELADVDGSAQQATGGMASFGAGLGGWVTVATTAVETLTKLVEGAVAVAEEFERQAAIISQFTGNIDEARARTGGLISDLDLMKLSNNAARQGLSLTGHELANVAVLAAKTSQALGTGPEGVTQATEQLIEALAKGEQGELAKFDIRLGTITDAADGTRRGLEQLEFQVGDTETGSMTAAGQMLNLSTQLENLETFLIKTVTETEQLTDAFDGLYQSGKDLYDALDEIHVAIFGESFTELFKDNIISLTAVVGAFADQLRDLVDGTRALFDFRWGDALDHLWDAASGGLTNTLARAREGQANAAAAAAGGDDEGDPTLAALGANVPGGNPFAASMPGGLAAVDAPNLTGSRRRGGRRGRSSSGREEDPQAAIDREIAARLKALQDEADQEIAYKEGVTRKFEEQEEEKRRAMAETARLGEKQRREEEKAAQDLARLKDELARQQMQTQRDVLETSAQGIVMLADAFGATEGPKQVIMAIIETARAASDYASLNIVGGAGHTLAAITHGIAAAKLGASGAPTGATPPTGGARPEATPSSATGGGGGPAVVTVNYNAPTAEAFIGRDTRRAQRAANRRFGAAA